MVDQSYPENASEPVAWLVLADGADNVRIWWRDKDRAEAWSRQHNKPLIPLYAEPRVAQAVLPLSVAQPPANCDCGVYNEVAARRGHQIAKGYDAAHDDSHNDGSIARGAAAFALAAFGPVTILADRRRHGMYRGREELTVLPSTIWPWDNGFHFPGPRDALIDAAAMIVAEIERLDRASPLPSTNRGGGK